MSHAINFATAFKVCKPDSSSKADGYTSERAEKACSFRDSLREALKCKRQDKRDPDETADAERKIANRPGTKLDNLKRAEAEVSAKVDSHQEDSEKQWEKTDKKVNEILSILEELAKLPQLAEMPEGMHASLTESIKEALKDLSPDVTKSIGMEASNHKVEAEKLKVLLEGMLEQLRKSGGLMQKEDAVDFEKQLKAVILKVQVQPEENMIAAADADASNIKQQQTGETAEAVADKSYAKAAEADNSVLKYENNDNMKAESKLANEAAANSKQGLRTEAPAVSVEPKNKESQPSIDENPADVKNALDGKVKKVVVSEKDDRKQDAEAGNIKESARDINKIATAAPDSRGNAEAAAINQEHAAAYNKVEKSHNQAAAAKPAPVNKAEVIHQIVKKAEIVLSDTQSEMRMQLEPENLGKLTLKLAVEKGLITAKFVTESYQVKQIIESNFNELRDMLQDKGLEVQNFSVSVGHENSEYNRGSTFHQWNEAVRLNVKSSQRGGYAGYHETDEALARAANPYSMHNGKFDQRA